MTLFVAMNVSVSVKRGLCVAVRESSFLLFQMTAQNVGTHRKLKFANRGDERLATELAHLSEML